MTCINKASNKTVEWCAKASILNIERFQKEWSVCAFEKNFALLIDESEKQ